MYFEVNFRFFKSQAPCAPAVPYSTGFIVGNSRTSRIAWLSVSSIVILSMPKPMPPALGGNEGPSAPQTVDKDKSTVKFFCRESKKPKGKERSMSK